MQKKEITQKIERQLALTHQCIPYFTLGEYIKACREIWGYSRKELGELIEKSDMFVHHLENNNVQITAALLICLCESLDIPFPKDFYKTYEKKKLEKYVLEANFDADMSDGCAYHIETLERSIEQNREHMFNGKSIKINNWQIVGVFDSHEESFEFCKECMAQIKLKNQK